MDKYFFKLMLKKKFFLILYGMNHTQYVYNSLDFIFICLKKKDGIFKIWVTRKEMKLERTDGKVATFELIYTQYTHSFLLTKGSNH